MTKAIGDAVYTIQLGDASQQSGGIRRVRPKELGLAESWYRDAIYHNPDLVIGPCRAAGIVPADEEWRAWRKEFAVDCGRVDVLLLSSRGQVAVVETKLSYNPEGRREVVAQVLDYALALQEIPEEDLPEIPNKEGYPHLAHVTDRLRRGELLLIIAGDAVEARAIRLAEGMAANHLSSPWDLAMIDLNLFRADGSTGNLLVVPELRGKLIADVRQVIRVIVEGESPKARVIHELTTLSESERSSNFASIEEFLNEIAVRVPELREGTAAVIGLFQQIAKAHPQAFRFQLHSSTANFYYLLPGSFEQKRIFSIDTSGRFRVRIEYLINANRPDIANLVQSVAETYIAFVEPERKRTQLTRIDQLGLDRISDLVNDVARALIQSRME